MPTYIVREDIDDHCERVWKEYTNMSCNEYGFGLLGTWSSTK